MIITLPELITWTGMTIFEIWMHLVALGASSIILVLKTLSLISVSFWLVFSPLFLACALDVYFLFIVFIRSLIEYKDCKGPAVRFVCNLLRVGLLTLFETMLCYKVEGDLEQGQVAVNSSYNIVFLPVWGLLALLTIQICKLF